MDSYQKEIALIEKILKENSKGMTVTDISRKIKINRNSVAKYLDIMRISGLVEMITFGPAKVFFPSKRVPISSMLNFTSDFILVIDRNQKIAMVNDSFLEFMKTEREELIGQSIGYTLLPVINEDQRITSEITDAIDGKKFNTEMVLQKDKEEVHFKIKIIPTTFEDGKNGAAIILKNITQQKLAEKALRYSEKNLKNLIGRFEK